MSWEVAQKFGLPGLMFLGFGAILLRLWTWHTSQMTAHTEALAALHDKHAERVDELHAENKADREAHSTRLTAVTKSSQDVNRALKGMVETLSGRDANERHSMPLTTDAPPESAPTV